MKIFVMKRLFVLFLASLLMLSAAACVNAGSDTGKDHAGSEEIMTSSPDPSSENSEDEAMDDTSEMKENYDMKMLIGDRAVPVTWEQNESADALRQLVREKPLTIHMSMYGGFEQVGSVGQSLPRNDVQTVTGAGDIVLYSGNQLVIFYGSNSWAYTRLGHIDLTQQEMKDLLGHGDVTITLE